MEGFVVDRLNWSFQGGDEGGANIVHMDDGPPGSAVGVQLHFSGCSRPADQVIQDYVHPQPWGYTVDRAVSQEHRAERVSRDLGDLFFGPDLRGPVRGHRVYRSGLIDFGGG